MADEEKKKLSPLAVGAGALGSVASMLIGSLFGDAGTIYGAALSSVTCSVGAFFFEDRTRRAHARLKARKEKTPGTKTQEHLADLPLERAIQDMRIREHLRRDWGLPKKLGVALGMLALCLSTAAVTLVGVEKVTGKTLSSSLGGPAQYGTTLGRHSTHSPAPVISVTPSYSVATVSPSATISASADSSPDASPDASPDLAPSTPSPSPDLTPSSPLPSGQLP